MNETSANVSPNEIERFSRKGWKKTTNEQFLMLVGEMDKFPEVKQARPVLGVNKVKFETTWIRLVDKLNSIGPPIRTMSEWKKVYSDLRGRMNKRKLDPETYLKTSKRIPKRTSFTLDSENSSDPLVSLLRSPKREPDLEISQDPTTSYHTEDEEEEETPVLYPDSPELVNFVSVDNTSHKHTQQSPAESRGIPNNPTNESQSFNLLQQQIQNQTMLLDILKNMTNNITVLLERQTAAAEKQVAATERQAAAAEAIMQLLRDGDCAEALGNLKKK